MVCSVAKQVSTGLYRFRIKAEFVVLVVFLSHPALWRSASAVPPGHNVTYGDITKILYVHRQNSELDAAIEGCALLTKRVMVVTVLS